MYDPALGRFLAIDPIADKYCNISSYAYVGNNPIVLVDKDGRIWEPSDAVKQSHALNRAMQTGKGQSLKALFTTGGMKNHIYKIREANVQAGEGGAGMGFIRDEKWLPINAITAEDIGDDLQLVFSVYISDKDLNSVSGSETFGHESFIHNTRKIAKASMLLKLIGQAPDQDIASALILISNQSDFTDENGSRVTHGGQLDHAKFLKGKKGTYNTFIGQLLDKATDQERDEILGEIQGYVDDLINNGDENVRSYSGEDAQEVFKNLQEEFNK